MPTVTRLVRKTAMFSGQVVAIQRLIRIKTFSRGQICQLRLANSDSFRDSGVLG